MFGIPVTFVGEAEKGGERERESGDDDGCDEEVERGVREVK